jgi:hypothetical protein
MNQWRCYFTTNTTAVCIGSHFAQLELRHALANFYRTFDAGVKPAEVNGFGENDMLQMSFFLTPRM